MIPERFRPYVSRFPALSLIGGTRLFEVPVPDFDGVTHGKIFAKAEWTNPGGSLKDRPVMWMLLDALDTGELEPGKVILDSSSGNAGIAYAMIGTMIGRRVEIVVPGNASAERKRRIKAHGATLVETDPIEGYDAALREARRRYAENPAHYFKPDQYANANNWRAHYESTAAEILAQTDGNLTHFVAGIGTGGSITGIGRRLKEHDARIQIVAVKPDPFPGIEGLKPLDTPDDIVPEILDQSVIDARVPVAIEDAFDHCAMLAKAGIFVGQSSGVYLKAAMAVARNSPSARVVTLFGDIGERYFSTGLWDA